jgi:hypothetical protein
MGGNCRDKSFAFCHKPPLKTAKCHEFPPFSSRKCMDGNGFQRGMILA